MKSELSRYVPVHINRFPFFFSHRSIRVILSGASLALGILVVVFVFRQVLSSLFFLQNLESWAKVQFPEASSTKKNQVLKAIKSCYVKKSSHLCLKGYNLTSLPDCIAEFTWITDLDLSDNAFKKIPLSIKFSGLRKLNLLNNPLEQVPKVVSSKLEFLHNSITA